MVHVVDTVCIKHMPMIMAVLNACAIRLAVS